MGIDKTKELIQEGGVVLGIEFGSTRIKGVLIDGENQVIASGSYDWENRLENNIWTYSLEDIWKGLQGCYRDMTRDVMEKIRRSGNASGSHRLQRHDARLYGL